MNCFECIGGRYVVIKRDYHAFIKDKDIVIPDVEVLTCTHCGDEILDDQACKKIDKAKEEYILKK